VGSRSFRYAVIKTAYHHCILPTLFC